MWPVRLAQTMVRAAPISCLTMRLRNTFGIYLVVLLLFGLPLFAIGYLLWEWDAYKVYLRTNYAYGRTPLPMVWFLWFVAILSFLTAYVWANILLGVGQKYNIISTREYPTIFLLKAVPCICPMNARAAMHVDRAQGFREVKREHKNLVELTNALRHPEAPNQEEMV